MSLKTWMPLYVADYLADTTHLRALESGAYLHLIMFYWQHSGLPQDDRALATVAKMTASEWRKARPTIAEFFEPGWRHKRIDAELVAAKEKYEKRAAAGKAGGEQKAKQKAKQKASDPPSNALAKSYQPQPHVSQSETEREIARARDPSAVVSQKAISLSNQALAAIRADPEASEWYGFPYLVQTWLTLGCSPEFILTKVTCAVAGHRVLPPQKYFDTTVRRAFEDSQQSKLDRKEQPHGNSSRGGGFGDALGQLRDSIAADEDSAQEGGANVVGLLPHGRRA